MTQNNEKVKVWAEIKVEKETLIELNKLILDNPLLEQGNNQYDLLMTVVISKYLEEEGTNE